MPSPIDACAQPNLLPPEEAIALLLSQVSATQDTELVSLEQAVGRVLAEDLYSGIDLPSFDNSAMDGYALRFDELNQDQSISSLTLAGSAFAGHPFTGDAGPNTCIRIMTGAPIPLSFDTVQMQEKTEQLGELIHIQLPKVRGANVRKRAEELATGALVLQKGISIGAAELGVIATIGLSHLRVNRRLKVAFFSTGDELRPVGSELAPGQIYDSNRYSIQGLLSKANVEIIDLGVVPDDKEAIREAFHTAAARADMILTSGGVSVGDADYTKQVLAEEGEVSFWRLAIKPGKPFAFGRIAKAIFCGLPGNPVSSMVTFYKLVWPLIQKMQGLTLVPPLCFQATLTTPIRKQAGRVEYQRGILSYDAHQQLSVAVSGGQGSGMLTSMSLANCFIILEQDQTDLAQGQRVTVEPFNSVLS